MHLQLFREEFHAFLASHFDPGIQVALHGLVDPTTMPARCGWGEAVGSLRQRSNLFADFNLKVLIYGHVTARGYLGTWCRRPPLMEPLL